MSLPKPYYEADGVTMYLGECGDVLPELAAHEISAIVTDPPYGLSFMGKRWDYDVPGVDIWRACLRLLKPGGHLLAFGGTRTHHRICCNIEDAGFKIRDMIAWVYGSGFPKSLDVGKAIDKAAGEERSKIQPGNAPAYQRSIGNTRSWMDDPGHKIDGPDPITNAAKQWDGWGTALKPALEPITVARKPLEGTVAANVQEHGTGAMNIDGCRVGDEVRHNRSAGNKDLANRYTVSPISIQGEVEGRDRVGRWPANLIHDGSAEAVGLFPETVSGGGPKPNTPRSKRNTYGKMPAISMSESYGINSGSAARFFYCAKTSPSERAGENTHPTVKPIDLMRYLCRLVTPPGGVVLDPFAGSAATLVAAILEGFPCIGIEQHEPYCEIAAKRLEAASRGLSVKDINAGQRSIFDLIQ